jgi:hypothetical protein
MENNILLFLHIDKNQYAKKKTMIGQSGYKNNDGKCTLLLLIVVASLLIWPIRSENPHHDCATAREFHSQDDAIQEDQAELEMFGKTVR